MGVGVSIPIGAIQTISQGFRERSGASVFQYLLVQFRLYFRAADTLRDQLVSIPIGAIQTLKKRTPRAAFIAFQYLLVQFRPGLDVRETPLVCSVSIPIGAIQTLLGGEEPRRRDVGFNTYWCNSDLSAYVIVSCLLIGCSFNTYWCNSDQRSARAQSVQITFSFNTYWCNSDPPTRAPPRRPRPRAFQYLLVQFRLHPLRRPLRPN